MTELTAWDHLIAVLVFVAYPVYARLSFKRTLAAIAAGGEATRVSAYRQIIITWFVFAVCVLGFWFYRDRPWADIGLVLNPDMRMFIAAAVAAAVTAVVILPLRALSQSQETGAKKLNEQMGELAILMPQSKREERWFYGVSVNAGWTEELIFRGYLIWYLQQFMSLSWAVAIAVLAFGLAHAYQGLKQLPGILFVSAVAVGLYVYTGSLLVPVVFHALLDGLQGRYIAATRRAGISGA